MKAPTASIATQLARQLIAAIRRDRANRYLLNADWTLPKLTDPIPDYDSPRFLIRDSTITIRAYASPDECDGATLAPDTIGPYKPVIAALFHDPWYSEMESIAAAWDWPVSKVRDLGDRIFYAILLAISPRILARAYYRFVRIFGGIAHWLMALFALLAIASLVGCCAPDAPFDPDDLHLPDYTKTASLDHAARDTLAAPWR